MPSVTLNNEEKEMNASTVLRHAPLVCSVCMRACMCVHDCHQLKVGQGRASCTQDQRLTDPSAADLWLRGFLPNAFEIRAVREQSVALSVDNWG